MHEVFISYSSKDANVAKAVCHRFEEDGIRCWMAPRDIKPSDIWADAINQAIKHAKVFILVFSENSNKSNQVSKELTLAVNSHLMILPLKIEDVSPTGAFEYYLSDIHWLDAINEPIEDGIAHMKDVISIYLKTKDMHQVQLSMLNSETKRENKSKRKSVILNYFKKALTIIVAILLAISIIIFLIFAILDIGYENSSFFAPYYEYLLGAYSIYMILALIGYVKPQTLLCKSRKWVTVFFLIPFLLLAIVAGCVMEEYENVYHNSTLEALFNPNNSFLDIQLDKRMSFVFFGHPKTITETSSNMQCPIIINFDKTGRVSSKVLGDVKNLYIWNDKEKTVECRGYKNDKVIGSTIIYILKMSTNKYVYEANGTRYEIVFRENGSINKASMNNNGQMMSTTYYYKSKDDLFPQKAVMKGNGQSVSSNYSNVETDSLGNVIKVLQTSLGQSYINTTKIEYY